MTSGAWWYRCHHNRCEGKGWPDVRPVLGLADRSELRAADSLGSTKGAKGSEGRQPQKLAPFGGSWHPSAEPEIIPLSTVERELVRWLWRDRVPLGKLTILDGDPGLGKSVITLDLAAGVTTRSAMPDGTVSDLDGPSGVVLLSAEDGLGDTVRPRLEAADADLTLVVAVSRVMETAIRRCGDEEVEVKTPRLPTLADLDALRKAIEQSGARLVIIDPIMAYLPGATNAHRDQDVRQALAPLAAMAEETGAAVLVVRHLNKASGGNPLYRGGGSIGIIGAARSGLVVAPDPDDDTETRRVLAPTKANLSAPAAALAYHLEAGETGVVRVVWEGASEHTAASLLAPPTAHTDQSAEDSAIAVLLDLLTDGPKAATEVQAAAKAADIAERTLDRAKKRLGVKSQKAGFGEGWLWSLPTKGAKEGEGCQVSRVGTLREPWHPSGPPELTGGGNGPSGTGDDNELMQWMG
jgi:hypothetical protein